MASQQMRYRGVDLFPHGFIFSLAIKPMPLHGGNMFSNSQDLSRAITYRHGIFYGNTENSHRQK